MAHWFALDVIEEYKKFLYLMAVSDHPVTPSIEVDQVWHLHLIYTCQYWNDFAKHMPFEPHHGPTKGGSQESEKFTEWYSKTLESYKNVFGMNPPVNILEPSVGFVMINHGGGCYLKIYFTTSVNRIFYISYWSIIVDGTCKV